MENNKDKKGNKTSGSNSTANATKRRGKRRGSKAPTSAAAEAQKVTDAAKSTAESSATVEKQLANKSAASNKPTTKTGKPKPSRTTPNNSTQLNTGKAKTGKSASTNSAAKAKDENPKTTKISGSSEASKTKSESPKANKMPGSADVAKVKPERSGISQRQKIGLSVGALVMIIAISALVFFANTPKSFWLNMKPLPQLTTTVASDEAEVELETTAGNVTIKLFPKQAPKASQNFLTLAKEGYYNNNEFFRVLKDFMIQSGSKDNSSGGDSKSIWGSGFATETSESLYPIRGALMLANSGTANSNGSQFFIVQNPNNAQSQATKDDLPTKIYDAYAKGGYPTLYGNYTVFGQVISGMNVVDKIANAKVTSVTTASGSSENSKPVDPIKIKSIKIIKDYKF